MLGAIIGDIIGSRFEWHNHRSKDFELFTNRCFATDDSIMTLAAAKAIIESKKDLTALGTAAVAIFMARTGKSIDEIREYIEAHYYKIDFTLDEIRDTYKFNESCQNTVPQALEAFFESTGFEDAIRNAISIGGDSDTLAAITGGMAQACYGIPENIRKSALGFLDETQRGILDEFECIYMK